MPSLHAIRAFEAAGRLGSFTRAAGELGLTQSAVSRHIRLLEDQLSLKLFERAGRRVRLTERGNQYHQAIRTAFALLRRASQHSDAKPHDNELRISTQPSIAALWLLPRLDAIERLLPGVEVMLDATRERVDFDVRYSDVCIRYGHGEWPEGTCRQLSSELLVPVCSPQFADDHQLWNDPKKVAEVPLLHDEWPGDWARWFDALCLDGSGQGRGMMFDETVSLYEAAQAGAGMALGRVKLVQRLLAEGRLVSPVAATVPSDMAYWVVTPPRGDAPPFVRRFIRWLEAELAVDSLAAASDQSIAESLS